MPKSVVMSNGKIFAPRRLEESELENPLLAIDRFFDYEHLPGIRDLLWSWMKITVTCSYCEIEDKQKRELLGFYELLEMLVEAAYVMQQKHIST
jgi:hypothetical protein